MNSLKLIKKLKNNLKRVVWVDIEPPLEEYEIKCIEKDLKAFETLKNNIIETSYEKGLHKIVCLVPGRELIDLLKGEKDD